jgi:hypothetical protein
VIQKDVVYHKSTKGAEAIATRQHGLTPKLRSMLIMVDGKRRCDDLLKLSATLGDPEQLLGQLLDQGFIEPIESSAPVHTAETHASTAPAPLAPATPAVTLTEAQRFAVRRLVDLLGPVADELCMRIESTRNAHDFQAAVTRAEATIREVRGPKMAADFAAAVQAHRPA